MFDVVKCPLPPLFHERQLTHVFRCAKNLSELSDRTQSACQAKVHDLYVSWRRQAGQEDVLWLREAEREQSESRKCSRDKTHFWLQNSPHDECLCTGNSYLIK